ncbi:MAG TPA: hypothetical protein VFS77_23125 [Pyrinomonadaceae bacterium]|nr:hypothetical protein [Pyrinomonadaceae bacterium]
MSAQKTFSQLSIAAVVLFIVSIPCLAQTDSITSEKSAEATPVVAVNIASATHSLPAEEKSVFAVKQKAPKFSAAQFMQAANEPAVKQSISFQPVVVPNEEKKSHTVNGITFVPSRGQKLPE